MKRTIAAAAAVLLGTTLMGCQLTGHRPGGNMSSIDRHTYISTPHAPLTVTLRDTRDESEFFSVDVPVGQKLVFQFYKNLAKDAPATTPDLMKWAIYDAKMHSSPLRSSMSAPPANSRMITVDKRRGVEFPAEPDDRWLVPIASVSDSALMIDTDPSITEPARAGSFHAKD